MIDNTPAEIYLAKHRGIDKSKLRCDPPGWPETLRVRDADLLPGMRKRPALVVGMNSTITGQFGAIQRIYLNADGSPVKVTDPDTGKTKSLKLSLGRVEGAAAMLSQPPSESGEWGLAEGVETALACIQLFGVPTWAAISSSNMANVKPPSWARKSVIFADNDHNGAGFKAANKTRSIWLQLGYFEAEDISVSSVDEVGKDFADLLLSRAA